jgi:putative ABC transport system permease protein
MTLLHRVASAWRWFWRRNRAEQDLHDELQAFVDMAAAGGVADGASPAEARRLAALQLGGMDQTKERVRAIRYGGWLDDVRRDVRDALRMCVRNPGFSSMVVLTLALGIGANTAVFSVIDAVLLRPLTYTEPGRIVVVHEGLAQRGRIPAGAAEFEEWRRSARSFDQMALMAVAPVILTHAGEPARLDAARVSPSLFPILGIDVALGRVFAADEETVGRDHVVILSDGLWRSRFGADPSVVGRTITLNDGSYLVIGVLPREFRFPRLEQLFVMGITGERPQLWMPFAITDAERGENSFAALGKLKRGVSPGQARDEVAAIMSELLSRMPNPPQLRVEVIPLREQVVGASRDVLALVWAAIAAVLLIACVNLANLLLARSATRGPELAIRAALGASRLALLRHSLIETMTLAIAGGVGGVLFARWSVPLLVRLAPASMPRLDEVTVDERALLFAALVTIMTGFIVGFLPARRAVRSEFETGLRVTARSSTLSRSDRAARGVMVTMQVALTLACLSAAGLVIQSLQNVLRVDPGFKSDQILTVDVSLSPERYRDNDARAQFAAQTLERIKAAPGVAAAGYVNRLPFSGISMNNVLTLEGTEQAPIPVMDRPLGDIRAVDAGYFQTLGIPLLHGDLFRDSTLRRPVALVSAALARRAWGEESPIGKRFRLSTQPDRLIEIIGVVGDVRNMGFETGPSLTVYLPYWQRAMGGSSFVVRTQSVSTAAAVRAAIAEIDRDVPIDSVKTMHAVLDESVATRSFQVTLLAVFGAIALALATIGVFGTLSYTVARQSKELGIRLALGATPGAIQRMVLGQVVRLVLAGLVLGIPLALTTGYLLRNALFGIGPYDLRVPAAASMLIALVAIAAGYLPAWRATRIDPMATLRTE